LLFLLCWLLDERDFPTEIPLSGSSWLASVVESGLQDGDFLHLNSGDFGMIPLSNPGFL